MLFLLDLGIDRVRMLTNNPAKMDGLESCGVRVSERVPLEMTIHDENRDYMTTKARRMNHLIDLANISA